MAHPAGEAASSPAPMSVADKAAEFENYLFDEGDPFEEQEEGDEPEADEAEEVETDEGEEAEQDDDGEEPDQPAIDPPVSLNAEEKTVFAQLPPEAQQAWAASETRRNQQVQEATTRASEAQRVAEAKAAQANAQADARLAVQLKEVVSAFAPQEPNPANYNDIRQYQHDKANFDYAKAQHDQFAQQVATIGVETPEQRAARIDARDKQLETIPEVADLATRGEYIQSAFAMAEELGYDVADLAENMDVGDLKALAQAAKWKADSEELARIRAKSNERIRDKNTGKFRTMKPGGAPHGDTRRSGSDKAWQKVKQAKGNRSAEGEAFADWLDTSGHL